MADLFENTAAARVALLVSQGIPGDDTDPGLFSMSIRVPTTRAVQIDTMAQRATKSRNEMVNLIIEAGISAIYTHLPGETRHEIAEHVSDQIQDYL